MPCGMSRCLPTLALAAVSGVKQTEQGLASGLQGTSGQAGGGLFLALTAAVVTVWTPSAQGIARVSVPSVVAQLTPLHAVLLGFAPGVPLFPLCSSLCHPLGPL